MKKKKVSSRMIAFFSPKCNQTMLVFSKAARKAAMMLEGDVRVQSNETQVPIVINPSNIQTTGITQLTEGHATPVVKVLTTKEYKSALKELEVR